MNIKNNTKMLVINFRETLNFLTLYLKKHLMNQFICYVNNSTGKFF